MTIIEKYLSGFSIPDLFRETGIPMSNLRYALNKAGVLRSRSEAVKLAAKHGKIGQHLKGKQRQFTEEWKKNISLGRQKWSKANAKGLSVKPNGYVEYTCGEHKGRSVHVVAMEQKIGRKLFSNEVVHHKDSNKQNNVIENLQLMTKAEHSSIHAKENLMNRKRNNDGKFK